MAKMNGFEIKGYKEFLGREGYGYNLNIYYKGKKVGSAINDASGGPVDIFFDNNFVKEDFYNLVEKVLGEGIENDAIMLGELITLKDYESHYKKAKKKGYKGIVVLSDDVIKEDFTMGKDPLIYSIPESHSFDDIGYEDYQYREVFSREEDFNKEV